MSPGIRGDVVNILIGFEFNLSPHYRGSAVIYKLDIDNISRGNRTIYEIYRILKHVMPAITFQPVDNEYEWGTYFDFKVLIMSRNGYINATKMCQDRNKYFKHWLNNQSSKDLVDEFVRSVGIPSNPLIMIKDGDNDYRGTYVHRKLITHIASWISPDIALKVSDIVEEYLLREQKIFNNKLISKKDDKISELEAKLDSILNDTGSMLDKMAKLSLENQITHEKLENAHITLNDMQNTLDIVVEDRVIKADDERFNNTISIYESVDQGPNMFYIFRVQKRSLKASVKRYMHDNPNAVKFFEIEYNPNSINYYTRFKQEYKGKIRSYYNKFELIGITKEQLRQFIDKIDKERYDIEGLI